MAPAPGGRRPNARVQLRASSPVCCNVLLGPRRGLSAGDLDGHPPSALEVGRGNPRHERAAVASVVERAAVDSGPAPTGAGRVRHSFEAAALRGRRAKGEVDAAMRARSPRRTELANFAIDLVFYPSLKPLSVVGFVQYRQEYSCQLDAGVTWKAHCQARCRSREHSALNAATARECG